MPTHRVLILGGGFGGIATAFALRERLDPADEIVLVDRRTTFVMGLRKNWAALDAGALSQGERPLARLAERGIRVVRGTIRAIHPAELAAEVDGHQWDADALVVALGAERDPDRVEASASGPSTSTTWPRVTARERRSRRSVAGGSSSGSSACRTRARRRRSSWRCSSMSGFVSAGSAARSRSSAHSRSACRSSARLAAARSDRPVARALRGEAGVRARAAGGLVRRVTVGSPARLR